MNMNFTPLRILETINREDNFVLVPSNILKDLLQSLVKNKFTAETNLYLKIFRQLKLSSANMEGNEVCQMFDSIKEIHDLGIFETDDKLKAEFYDDILKFFINKLVELQKRKIEPNNTHLISMLKTFEAMNICNSDVEDMIVNIMATRTSNSFPAVIESLRYLSEENNQKLIAITIAHLKDKRADIRHLKFNDLFLFMIEVIKHSEKDISHFFKYLEKIFQNEVDEKFDINIMSDLFFCAVEYGYITKASISQFLYHYLFQLCEQHEKLEVDRIPGVLWAMAYTEEKDLPNPLIPILLEKLSKSTLSNPMTEEQAAKLHQLIMFVDEKVQNVKYPPEYKEIFSEAIRKVAKRAYLAQDVCLDKDVQLEIGQMMLEEMRISFKENHRVNEVLHTDFYFKDTMTSLLIESQNNLNSKGTPKAFYGFKKNALVKEVPIIKVINREDWEQGTFEEKLKLLSQFKFKIQKAFVM